VTTQQYSGADFGDLPVVHMGLTYDDVTLAVLATVYQNDSTKDAAAIITTPQGVDHTFIVKAGSSGSNDLSAFGLKMTRRQIVHNGRTVTLIELPAGYSAAFRYPA